MVNTVAHAEGHDDEAVEHVKKSHTYADTHQRHTIGDKPVQDLPIPGTRTQITRDLEHQHTQQATQQFTQGIAQYRRQNAVNLHPTA